jgi:dGTPase
MPAAEFKMHLAPYAARVASSKGRVYPEPQHAYRGEYERDRDRVIHSTAFRRLVYKTQVFVNHEGDLYRTRLTHSLEVAQIARTVAGRLGLNEQLVEAICLSHDLGHTPFGHAGQDALNRCMADYGGFEHNLQSLRVVDKLEHKYAGFPGLNLMFETREGILKHCSNRNARLLGDLGERFLQRRQPGLEAQLANLADAIAYNNHDVDDGLRAGLLGVDELQELQLFGEQHVQVMRQYPQLSGRRMIHETVRAMINRVVTDLIDNSLANLQASAPESIDAVRELPPQILFSESMFTQHLALKKFLNESLYRHEKVVAMTRQADTVVTELFGLFMSDPALLPADYTAAAGAQAEQRQARAVADYVAGMTDRYALSEHSRLTGRTTHL